jgi:hypothetical protein
MVYQFSSIPTIDMRCQCARARLVIVAGAIARRLLWQCFAVVRDAGWSIRLKKNFIILCFDRG